MTISDRDSTLELAESDKNRRSKPRISVVITSYNHAEFIEQAIQSVLGQTQKPFEVIVIDDASTDNSLEIISKYHEQLRVIRNTENMGGTITASLGVEAAKGDFIAILNSDDYWKPTKLQKQLQYLLTNQLDCVFSWVEIVDADSKIISPTPRQYEVFNTKSKNPEDFLAHFFYKGNFLCHSSILARRRLFTELGGYDSRLRQLPDFAKWVTIAKFAKLGIFQEKLVMYRSLGSRNTSFSGSLHVNIRTRFEHVLVYIDFFNGITDEKIVEYFSPYVKGISVGNKRLQNLERIYYSITSSLKEPARLAFQLIVAEQARAPDEFKLLHDLGGENDIFKMRKSFKFKSTLKKIISRSN